MKPFSERLSEAVLRCKSPLCVGIDPHLDRLPATSDEEADAVPFEETWGADARRAVQAGRALHFGEAIVEAIAGKVPAVKPQFAFFEALGAPGMVALSRLCRHARAHDLLVIGDGKRVDIASTAAAYAAAQLGEDAPFPCDAATVAPYLGPDSMEPWLARLDRTQAGMFALVRTSNPGSGWQADIFRQVAAWVEQASAHRAGPNGLGPVGAVVGATHPALLGEMRAEMPHSWLLLPGFGAQGATAADTRGAFRADGLGALVVGARALTFPDQKNAAWDADPRPFVAAKVDEANQALRQVLGW